MLSCVIYRHCHVLFVDVVLCKHGTVLCVDVSNVVCKRGPVLCVVVVGVCCL